LGVGVEAVLATQVDKKPISMVGGIVITAGTAVGAGMFALPVVSSGMWFGWSLVSMLLSWFVLYRVSLMILEVNLHFRPGDSFSTMVTGTLGKRWSVVNGLLFAFLMYILDYAYISGGGAIVNQTLQSTLGFAPPKMLSGLIFAFLLSSVVWFSTKAVDRVASVLIVGMLLTFAMAAFDLTLVAQWSNLIASSSEGQNGLPGYYYMFAALPVYLTSFGYYGSVPSLVKYYGKKPKTIARAMLIGSLGCFAIYALWLAVTFGNLNQAAFLPIIAKGGNIDVLVGAINEVVTTDGLDKVLGAFANMAIVSSFLGVSLCLFDFIADKFNFDDSGMGRFKTALVVFVPPTIGGILFPDGFIEAIGYAGLVCAINALIIPPLMLKKSRQIFGETGYSSKGGDGLIYFIIAMGVFFALCKIFSILGWLPVFGH
jgi:tryptophan-specific transport protein